MAELSSAERRHGYSSARRAALDQAKVVYVREDVLLRELTGRLLTNQDLGGADADADADAECGGYAAQRRHDDHSRRHDMESDRR